MGKRVGEEGWERGGEFKDGRGGKRKRAGGKEVKDEARDVEPTFGEMSCFNNHPRT